MVKLIIKADDTELDAVMNFIKTKLNSLLASEKDIQQTLISAEEIFINIAHYAYDKTSYDTENRVVEIGINKTSRSVEISFRDGGIKYNPLTKADPNITLSAEERGIGGLGIYMVKKMVDDIKYEYLDGKNILTISKNIKLGI